ncbi:hypothetical protein FQN54_003823 [Arachnomyces sp. PD_36]|nr:hypothetical protein FQN54_003823 [Arachnomyces sp. PD_36]
MPNSSYYHGYLPEEFQMSNTTQRQKANSYEDLMRPDEDWRSLPDSADRRKIQNRLAQRSYRRNVKRQREELEELKLQLQGQSRKLQCNATNQAHFNQGTSTQNFQDQNVPVLVPQTAPNSANEAWAQAGKQQTIEQSPDINGRSRAVSGHSSPAVSSKDQYQSPVQQSQSVDFRPQNLQVAQTAPSRKRSFTDSSFSPNLQPNTTSRAHVPQPLPLHQPQQQQQQSSQTPDMQSQTSGTPVLTPQQQPFLADFHTQDLPYGDGSTSPPMVFGDMSCFTEFTKIESSASEDGRQRDAGLGVTSIPGVSPNSQATFPPTPPVSSSLASRTWPSSSSTDEDSVKNEETSNQTMLHLAAEKGHEGVLRLLLERGGIDIDSRDSGGYTALHRAVQRGRMGIVRILLEHEADMNARTTQFPY